MELFEYCHDGSDPFLDPNTEELMSAANAALDKYA